VRFFSVNVPHLSALWRGYRVPPGEAIASGAHVAWAWGRRASRSSQCPGDNQVLLEYSQNTSQAVRW